MELTEQRVQPGEVSFSTLGAEVRYYLGKAPDTVIFAGLLAAWALLFHFFGWTSNVRGNDNSLFSWMWMKWSDLANDAEHGKLIPLVVLGLLWHQRKQLIESMRGAWWPALIGLGLASALHIVGFLVQQPRFSMIALFGGAWMLIGLVWGWRTMRVAFFPFFLFGFCVPMGGTFAQGLTLPLRLLAAKGAYMVTHDWLQVAVARSGTRLFDPMGKFGNFDVAAECSGIRSFTALLAITTIFSVLTMKSWWRRGLTILATIPLALICNMVRVTTIVLAANAYDNPAAGAFVDRYFGYVTYGIAICGMLLLARLLREEGRPQAAPP